VQFDVRSLLASTTSLALVTADMMTAPPVLV
jgi:hypothetical protein